PGDAFVAKVAIDFEHLVEPAHQQTFQIKLQRYAQIEIDAKCVVMCFERFGRRTSSHCLQNWRLHFNKTPVLKKAPGFANDGDPFFEYRARTFVCEKIKITLPVTRFGVLQSMPFFRERSQG